jgi:hypothetical protein
MATGEPTMDDDGRSPQVRRLAISAMVVGGVAVVLTVGAIVGLSTNGTITRPDWPTRSGWWWAGFVACAASAGMAIAARSTHRRSDGEAGRLVSAVTAAAIVVVTIWVASTAFLILTARTGLLEAIPGRPRRRRAGGIRCSPPRLAAEPSGQAAGGNGGMAEATEPNDAGPNDAERQLLAASWARAAGHELEAVSSFLQLESELIALDAPDHLVTGARRAARQEIDHTDICRRLARQHGAEAEESAPRPFRAPTGPPRCRLGRRYRVLRLAIESYVDGCSNEGGEAARLRYASTRAVQPLGATLARIADDEHEHAELAWSTVDWAAIECGPLVRRCLAILPIDRSPTRAQVPAGVRPEVLAEHGWVLDDGSVQAVVAARVNVRARLSGRG